ncbi:hypothetical protein AAG906_011006 [Vitis piasezkii]
MKGKGLRWFLEVSNSSSSSSWKVSGFQQPDNIIIIIIITSSSWKASSTSHPQHPLDLKNYQKPYICDGCKEQGFGSRYRCELCNYDLHADCAFTDSTTSHKFFKACTFKFLDQRPGKCCNSHCKDCMRYYIDGIKFHLRGTVSSKCIWCNQRNPPGSVSGIRGWSYVSKCKNYRFHVYCATEMVNQVWKNGGSKDSNECLSIENVKLPLPVSLNRSGGSGSNSFMRIVKVFLKTIAGILLGDPTITLTSLFVELVFKE